MSWFEALDNIKPYIFKIATPNGTGTGFQISYSPIQQLCGIATAYHVIAHAFEWEEPIKVTLHETNQYLVLKPTPDSRIIIPYPEKDLAFILFDKQGLNLNTNTPNLVPPQSSLKPGVEIGWCGFPSVAPNELCFFAGYTSCWLANDQAYLVDGVAINGVSGGPAFFVNETNQPMICGVISAYISNKATGETLPGLSVVRSVEPYQPMLENLKSLDQAEQIVEEQKTKSEISQPINENAGINEKKQSKKSKKKISKAKS